MSKKVMAIVAAGVDDETGEYYADLEVQGKKVGGLTLGKDWSSVVDAALSFAFMQRTKADDRKRGPIGVVPDES